MKKFFTSVSQQPPERFGGFCYQAVDNSRLQMAYAVHFPILTAISGYALEGESIRVIAACTDSDDCRANLQTLQQETEKLCKEKHLLLSNGIEAVFIPAKDDVLSGLSTFQRLIAFAEEDDDLYGCITYGTKPQANALLLAVQYAYRTKKDATLGCIVYGAIDRTDRSHPVPYVYDETAMVQMDELIHQLAERGVKDPKKIIDTVISL